MQDYAIVATPPGGSEALARRGVSTTRPRRGVGLAHHDAIGLTFLDIYRRSGLRPGTGPEDLTPGSDATGRIDAAGGGACVMTERHGMDVVESPIQENA